MSITDLIQLDKHRIKRKLYIKRRDATTGAYESSWVQIDDWNGINIVVDWGSVSINIDQQPGIIASFEVSGISIVVDNNDGYFNLESYPSSIWYPETTYLNRRYTKVKIETMYLNEDDTETGTADDFEGVIDSVVLSESGLATLNILSYQSIFARYPISDLNLTGSVTASSVVTSICNQSKITTFMPYVAPVLSQDYTISDASDIDGTYWDVLQEIAFKSNSTIVLEGSAFKIIARSGGSVVWNFKGSGSDDVVDIYTINEYDDEGIGKIRVYWKEEGGSTESISSDSTLLLKYLSEPELVDLTNIASGSKQGILDALRNKWEKNIPVIDFDCKYLLNQISLLDKITIDIRGRISPSVSEGGCFYDAGAFWDDGVSFWGKETGGIIIASSVEWVVTQIIKDFQSGKMSIKAERV